jgi:two-component system sensor histidine kinase/response regulator
LTNIGYNISVTFDGESTLGLIRKLKTDLIYLDVMMPGLDGFEVWKCLKEYPEVSDIPFIFITAMRMPKDVLTGFKSIAVDYITKHFNLQEVCVRVKTNLTLSAAKKNIPRQWNWFLDRPAQPVNFVEKNGEWRHALQTKPEIFPPFFVDSVFF